MKGTMSVSGVTESSCTCKFQYEHEMGTTRLRIVVDDPDALYAEYKNKDVFYEGDATRRYSLGNP